MKLTKGMKSTIINKMENYAFKQRLVDAQGYLAQLCYERLMTPQRVALPEFLIKDGWIKTTTSCRIEVYERTNRIDAEYVTLPKAIPTKTPHYNNEEIRLDAGTEDTIAMALKAYNIIEREKGILTAKLEDILAACNTDKQLVELLPEAVDFIPDVVRVNALVPADKIMQVRSYFTKDGQS